MAQDCSKVLGQAGRLPVPQMVPPAVVAEGALVLMKLKEPLLDPAEQVLVLVVVVDNDPGLQRVGAEDLGDVAKDRLITVVIVIGPITGNPGAAADADGGHTAQDVGERQQVAERRLDIRRTAEARSANIAG